MGEIEVEKLVRDAALNSLLSERTCRDIFGAHVYVDVPNFADLVTLTGEGEDFIAFATVVGTGMCGATIPHSCKSMASIHVPNATITLVQSVAPGAFTPNATEVSGASSAGGKAFSKPVTKRPRR